MSKEKKVSGGEEKQPVKVGEPFFFPQYQLTIVAASLEEAQEKLAQQLAGEQHDK